MKLFKLLSCFLVLLSVTSHAQKVRNTMWLGGFGATSHGYQSNIDDYWNHKGFAMIDLVTSNTSSNAAYNPSLGVNGASSNLENLIAQPKEVLGIAHDYGGLVLRNLANGNNNLSAIILDGVPNQGSEGINFILEKNGVSKMENVLTAIEEIKGGESCADCGYINLVKNWVDAINDAEDVYSEMAANSAVVNNLNLTANLPQVPYVVLWGSMDNSEHTITNMLSNWYLPGTGNNNQLTKCYVERLARAREEAKDDFIIATIDNTVSFFGKVTSAVLSYFEDGLGISEIIANIKDNVEDAKQAILDQMEAIKDRDDELARILRCELANQLVATEWHLALLDNQNFESEEVTSVPSYQECLDQCNLEGWEDQSLYNYCIPNCLNSTVTVTVYVAEENDGLLTKTEQRLPGHVREYHLANTNHIQETDFSWGTLESHLEDIFDGAAGPAFVVPRI